MSEPIVFTVFIPDGAELKSPDLMNLGVYAIFKGTESYSVDGGTEFRFNQRGINKITTENLAGIAQFGALGVRGVGQVGPRYMEMTDKEYHAEVPTIFPRSSKHVEVKEGEDPVLKQMTFNEYCPFGATQSLDQQSWLFNISERAEGETCGDGTSWEEFLVWAGTYGLRVLSAAQMGELLASEKYTKV